ncbi:MAG: hypothetical protein LBG98_02145 [Puniceicoccales bacterium]|nr:hypothetical protein [Puniceicoccales bacterium]
MVLIAWVHLHYILPQLAVGQKSKIISPIEAYKDSVVLLRDFLHWMKSATVYPVLNLCFGKDDEFHFYRASQDIHEAVLERGNVLGVR